MDNWYDEPYDWPVDPFDNPYRIDEDTDELVCVSCGQPIHECECNEYNDY